MKVAIQYGILSILILAYPVQGVAGDPPLAPDAVKAIADFDKAEAAAKADYDKRIAAAKEKTVAALQTAVSKATKAGDLDAAMAIKAEITKLAAAPEGSAPAATGGTADLIQSFKSQGRPLRGEWKVDKGALVMTEEEFSKCIVLRESPEEYDFVATAEPIFEMTKWTTVAFGFRVGDKQLLLTVSGWGEGVVDGQKPQLAFDNAPIQAVTLEGFEQKKPANFRFSVRKDELKVFVNDTQVVTWKIDQAAIRPMYANWKVDAAKALYLGNRHANMRWTALQAIKANN